MAVGAEVDNRIREVMADVLEIEPSAIVDGFGPDDAPSWDSLAHLRLVTALEEALRVKFTMKEVGEMGSYDAIRRLVSQRLGG